jgi:hypothetical protein
MWDEDEEPDEEELEIMVLNMVQESKSNNEILSELKGAGFVSMTLYKVKKVVQSLKESGLLAGERVRRKCKRSFPAQEVCICIAYRGEV